MFLSKITIKLNNFVFLNLKSSMDRLLYFKSHKTYCKMLN